MALQPTIGHIDPKSERASWWQEVFGGLDVPLRSPLPELMNLPDEEGGMSPQRIYWVDMSKITEEQVERLARFVADKFDLPVDDVLAEIKSRGIHIKAEGVSVSFDARLIL